MPIQTSICLLIRMGMAEKVILLLNRGLLFRLIGGTSFPVNSVSGWFLVSDYIGKEKELQFAFFNILESLEIREI